MADSARRSTRATRGKSRNYRPQDEYDFLDSEDERNARASGSARTVDELDLDDEDDEDTFQPSTEAADQWEDQEEEFLHDEGELFEDDEEEDAGGSDEELGPRTNAQRTPKGKGKKGVQQERVSTVAAAEIGVAIGKSLTTPKRRQSNPFKKSGAATKVHSSGLAESKANYDPKNVRPSKKGVADRSVRGQGQENRLRDLFGPDRENLEPVIRTRERWKHQEALPSREDGSLRRSYYVNEEARLREIDGFRKWYSDHGASHFQKGQRSTRLSAREGMNYVQNDGPEKLNMLMGPMPEPELYTLQKGACLSTATPFKEGTGQRRGWVFYLGARIQESQWAATEEGSSQYLAVAVEQHPPTERRHPPTQNPQAPAFSRTAGFSSAIQILSFASTEGGDLDNTKAPQLELVICTDWGAPKRFRWCYTTPADPAEAGSDEGIVRLGLLAGIWSDGVMRVLDISYPKSQGNFDGPRYVHYSQAAFEVSLPDSVPTCLHWLSATSLAVGTASGKVGIWTLTRDNIFSSPENITEKYKAPHNPLPWFYRQVADTYILTVTSGWPSRPTYLSITTADGYAKLIDLRSPVADTAVAQRGRMFSATQVWHEHTQSFIMPDDAYILRHNSVRRFFTNISSMKLPSQISCCAASPVQPGVLVGCADGSVIAGNPVGRIMNSKDIPWHHTWFTHEWRPPVSQLHLRLKTASAPNSNNGTPAPTDTQGGDVKHKPRWPQPQTKHVDEEVLQQPMVRITEGYKLQPVQLQSAKGSDRAPIKHLTIYEEPSMVTCLAWNPNLKFGTWACAGMGSGVLRVEDLDV